MFEHIQELDDNILEWFQAHHTKFLDQNFINLTALGSTTVVLVVTLIFLGVLLTSGMMWRAVLAALAIATSFAVVETGKFYFERPRPVIANHLIPTPHSGSMPSSHAAMTMALFLIMAFSAQRYRRYCVFWAFILSLLIGISRMYLGVHFFSDVVVGWTIGLFFGLEYYWIVIHEQMEHSV